MFRQIQVGTHYYEPTRAHAVHRSLLVYKRVDTAHSCSTQRYNRALSASLLAALRSPTLSSSVWHANKCSRGLRICHIQRASAAPQSVCVPSIIGVLAVWIQNPKQKTKKRVHMYSNKIFYYGFKLYLFDA